MSKRDKLKFQPEHFPVGTVFRLNPDMIFMHRDDAPYTHDRLGLIFTTAKVVRNGLDSYAVQTTTPEDSKYFPPGTMHAYNLAHIDAVIMRGRGPLLIEQPNELQHIEWLYNDRQDDQMSLGRFGGGLKSSRSHYQWMTTEVILEHLQAKYLPDGHYCFDTQRAVDELSRQSFVIHYPLGYGRLAYDSQQFEERLTSSMFWVWTAPKKRVDAWFLANRNRFLCNLYKAAAEYDRAMSVELDGDMDALGRHLGDADDSDDWGSGDGPRPQTPPPPLDGPSAEDDSEMFALEAQLGC